MCLAAASGLKSWGWPIFWLIVLYQLLATDAVVTCSTSAAGVVAGVVVGSTSAAGVAAGVVGGACDGGHH